MKTLQIYLFLIVPVLSTSNNLQGQNNNNQEIIKNIYDVVQNHSKTSNDLAALTPGIKWDEVINPKEMNDRDNITFPAVMQNQWGHVLFNKIIFQEVEQDKVLVTGTVNGRQPSECEFVSTRFKHYWTIKDGQVIKFLE